MNVINIIIINYLPEIYSCSAILVCPLSYPERKSQTVYSHKSSLAVYFFRTVQKINNLLMQKNQAHKSLKQNRDDYKKKKNR